MQVKPDRYSFFSDAPHLETAGQIPFLTQTLVLCG